MLARFAIACCVALTLCDARLAGAAITVPPIDPANHVPMLLVATDNDKVTLAKLEVRANASAAMRAALLAEYPGWTFDYSQELNGTLTIDKYAAESNGLHNGGGTLVASYERAATDPPLADLQLIQLVSTNAPLAGAKNPGIDPTVGAQDGKPYYHTAAEAANNKAAGSDGDPDVYVFDDGSRRDCRRHPDSITWSGELLLASSTGAMSARVYGGVSWGYTFVCVVPEPSGASLALLAIAGALSRRRGKSRGKKGDLGWVAEATDVRLRCSTPLA
jgi:hypothetical protein